MTATRGLGESPRAPVRPQDGTWRGGPGLGAGASPWYSCGRAPLERRSEKVLAPEVEGAVKVML